MGWIIKTRYFAQSENPRHRVSKSFGSGGIVRYCAWIVEGREQKLIGAYPDFESAKAACERIDKRNNHAT